MRGEAAAKWALSGDEELTDPSGPNMPGVKVGGRPYLPGGEHLQLMLKGLDAFYDRKDTNKDRSATITYLQQEFQLSEAQATELFELRWRKNRLVLWQLSGVAILVDVIGVALLGWLALTDRWALSDLDLGHFDMAFIFGSLLAPVIYWYRRRLQIETRLLSAIMSFAGTVIVWSVFWAFFVYAILENALK